MTTAFGKDPLSSRGRWVVIAVATAVMQLSYWPAVAAAWADPTDDVVTAGMIVGLSAVPFVFMLVAFASRHPRAPWAVVRAMGLFVVVALPLGMLHVASGVAAGYAAGGLAALRAPEGLRSRPARISMVVAITFSITILLAVALEVGLVLGALLPFPAIGLADRAASRRAQNVT
jgi:hypothetical protein